VSIRCKVAIIASVNETFVCNAWSISATDPHIRIEGDQINTGIKGVKIVILNGSEGSCGRKGACGGSGT